MTDATVPLDPAASPDKGRLIESLVDRFGRFFTLFGSAALVVAFLIYAGFLSEYGAFRLAGLPRLNMTLTSLTEQGAEVLIDSFALLASGLRVYVVFVGLALVVTLWGWHGSVRLKLWAESVPAYWVARIALLVLAILVFGSTVERAQRSLSGAHYSRPAIESALIDAYAGRDFPTPYERELAIERQTYELRGYWVPNWGSRLDIAFQDLLAKFGIAHASSDQSDRVSGIELRRLPEARAAARHVFGWISVSVLGLVFGIVLLGWWSRWLRQEQSTSSEAGDTPPLPAVKDPSQPKGNPLIWPLRALERAAHLLGPSVNQPMERLLAPLTVLLAVFSIALLPLAHGLLAREALGAETVMVYLKAEPASGKESESGKSNQGTADESEDDSIQGGTAESLKPSGASPDDLRPSPTRRLNCNANSGPQLEKPLEDYAKSLRNLLQERPTESGFDDRKAAVRAAIDVVMNAAIGTNCADVVSELWAARPPTGLSVQFPEVAQVYKRAFDRVQATYNVRVGTLLGYPRDAQGLTLANSIVPLPLALGGQSSVLELPRKLVEESIVIPDIKLRRLLEVRRVLSVDPDSNLKGQLLFSSGGESLGVAIQLLTGGKLHANASGVAVTAIGTMAAVATVERPEAATRAIDLLADLAARRPSDFWPEKSDDIRGTAVSALHLAGNPYGAHRFIEALKEDAEGAKNCSSGADTGLAPLPCLTTVPTAAGFVFQDLVTEIQNFQPDRVPARLTRDREALLDVMVDIVTRPDVRDDVRGAACTAIGFGGKIVAKKELQDRYWKEITSRPVAQVPFSAPICLSRTTVLGLERGPLREHLRNIATGASLEGLAPGIRRTMRLTALISLLDLGLSSESELLLNLYIGTDNPEASDLAGLAISMFKEVEPESMAKRLVECARDPQRKDATRSRCLHGIEVLNDNFEGDDGTAAKIYALAASDPALAGDSCSALLALKQRGSKWLARLPETDELMRRCMGNNAKAAGSASKDRSDRATRLREMLEKLEAEKLAPGT